MRGFQGCIEAGISIELISEYTVYNNNNYQVVANVHAKGRNAKERVSTKKLDGPTDIIIRVRCQQAPYERGPSGRLHSVVIAGAYPMAPHSHVCLVFRNASQTYDRAAFHDFQCRDTEGSEDSRIAGENGT